MGVSARKYISNYLIRVMQDLIDYDDDMNTADDKLAEFLERYDKCKSSWKLIHEAYISDLKFADGDQWDPKVLATRNQQNLSSLTYNQIPPKIKYIVNNIRQNTPQIKCNPVSNGATKETAKVIDGIIKYIQYKSNAKHSYINGVQNAVTGGIGAWRVNLIETIDYDGDGVNEYDIALDRIQDPTTVVIDPSSVKQDFSDAEYMYVTSWISRDEFKERWPDAEEGSVDNKDYNSSMFKQDQIAILEYWCKNKETGLVEQYIINGNQILQAPDPEAPYPGKLIPIVMCVGEESYIDGERKFKGIVRDIKDMQILLNLTKSRTGDYIARASNQPWLVEEEQINKYQQIWMNSNVNGAAVLPYKATAAGKPERVAAVEPPSGYMQVSAEADQDIRQAIGIRDPLADIPATQSGKAVKLQIAQSNIGTFGFVDNLNSAIKYTGDILLDLIPHVYSEAQVREIMGNDGNITTVQINAPYVENGQTIMHDLQRGKYVCTIDDGPDYQSQREEAADMLMEIVGKNPQFLQIAGDIVFRNLNFDGSSEIADRLRAQIPPNVLAASSAGNGDAQLQTQILQNNMLAMQQQMQQMQMQNQQMQQFIMQLQQEKQAKTTEIQTKGQVEAHLRELDHAHEVRMANINSNNKSEEIAQKGVIDLTLMHDKEIIDNDNDRRDNHNKIFHSMMQHDLRMNIPNG